MGGHSFSLLRFRLDRRQAAPGGGLHQVQRSLRFRSVIGADGPELTFGPRRMLRRNLRKGSLAPSAGMQDPRCYRAADMQFTTCDSNWPG